jgi:transcriptional regulator with XRE-family HTH domain
MNRPISLQEWRKSKALTQQDVADAIGVHVQYVSAIERGARRPGMKVASRIREFSGGVISLDALAPRPVAIDRRVA